MLWCIIRQMSEKYIGQVRICVMNVFNSLYLSFVYYASNHIYTVSDYHLRVFFYAA